MICLETNPGTGDLRAISPQPADLTTCSLVAGTYAETVGASELWRLSASEGSQVAGAILLLWAVAYVFRLIARALDVDTVVHETKE